MDEFPVVLDRDAGTPLSAQVAVALRTAATDGALRTGDRLPSTRTLATRLGVSRTVTAAAYEQLHAEGWIAGRRGSGTVVVATPEPVPAQPSEPLAEPGPRLIELTSGHACTGVIDRAAWRRAWRAAADTEPPARHDRAGIPPFLAAVADHLLRHRGLVAEPRDMLATAGTSSAVAEFARSVLCPGDRVAIEEPGYTRARAALEASGIRVVPVPLDSAGLRVDALPTDVRAIYCSPAHQFPLGIRMPAARRIQLIEFARAHGALLLEDDYDGELRYDAAPLPLLAALAPDVVVHLGTTSKIISPMLGVGWLVAPPAVVAAVLDHRVRSGSGPSVAGQLVFAEFARHGDLARHLRRLRKELAARRALVTERWRRAGGVVDGDEAGAHVVVRLASAAHERELVRAAHARGVHLDGLARHFAGPPTRHGIVLGYSGCSRAELLSALAATVTT